MSKSADRCLPFFETLKKASHFSQTLECQSAFDELKTYLLTPPLLVILGEAKPLNLYLTASDNAMVVVLVNVNKLFQTSEKKLQQG